MIEPESTLLQMLLQELNGEKIRNEEQELLRISEEIGPRRDSARWFEGLQKVVSLMGLAF